MGANGNYYVPHLDFRIILWNVVENHFSRKLHFESILQWIYSNITGDTSVQGYDRTYKNKVQKRTSFCHVQSQGPSTGRG